MAPAPEKPARHHHCQTHRVTACPEEDQTGHQRGAGSELVTPAAVALGSVHQPICSQSRRLYVPQRSPARHQHPICLPSQWLPLGKWAAAEQKTQGMAGAGILEHSCSLWAAPAVLVKKKDSSWCFCVAYRHLKDITHQDSIRCSSSTLTFLSFIFMFIIFFLLLFCIILIIYCLSCYCICKAH